jgi:pSer/pThr/pTyr-binding forkhead associated (FHA) protein
MGVVVEHLGGRYAGWVQEIDAAEVTVGRTEESQLRFDAQDDSVSGRHAQLKLYADGFYYVTDLGSRNGTFLNGQPLRGTLRCDPGATLRFGPMGPEVRITYAPTPWRG